MAVAAEEAQHRGLPRGHGVLRAAVCPENGVFVRNAQICHGNKYATTDAVLSSSVIKLGKIEKAGTVYRAPGGALPSTFWRRNTDGVMGGLEERRTARPTARASGGGVVHTVCRPSWRG